MMHCTAPHLLYFTLSERKSILLFCRTPVQNQATLFSFMLFYFMSLSCQTFFICFGIAKNNTANAQLHLVRCHLLLPTCRHGAPKKLPKCPHFVNIKDLYGVKSTTFSTFSEDSPQWLPAMDFIHTLPCHSVSPPSHLPIWSGIYGVVYICSTQ